MKRITTIRNLFALLAALVFATGCTTAKTLGTPSSAVAATPAADSSDSSAADASTDAGGSDSGSSDSGGSGSSDSGGSGSSDSATDASTETGNGTAPLMLWMVSEGEHLWGISSEESVYGDPYQWPLLFKRNRDQIDDADLIFPGQMLYIERDLNAAEVDRAIQHAKTRGAWTLGITELTDLEYLSRERSYE